MAALVSPLMAEEAAITLVTLVIPLIPTRTAVMAHTAIMMLAVVTEGKAVHTVGAMEDMVAIVAATAATAAVEAEMVEAVAVAVVVAAAAAVVVDENLALNHELLHPCTSYKTGKTRNQRSHLAPQRLY